MFARLLRALAIAGASTLAAAAIAASPGAIEIKATVLAEQRVAARDGSTQVVLVPASRITPGDHVVYRLAYRNTGSAAASGVVIADPLPEHVQYVGPAPGSPTAELSVDGKTFGPLATLTMPTAAGTRPARAADVRAVRWRVAQPVAPGAGGDVSFRAVLK